MAMEMDGLALDESDMTVASPDAAEMFDLAEDEMEEQQTTNREVEQNVEAEAEAEAAPAGPGGPPDGPDGNDVANGESPNQPTDLTPTAGMSRIAQLLAAKNAADRAAKGVSVTTTTTVVAPVGKTNGATAPQAAQSGTQEQQADGHADILDKAMSMMDDTKDAMVADAKQQSKKGVDGALKSVARGVLKSQNINPTNSIDAGYLSGNVSAIGMPVVMQNGQQAIIMIGTPVVMLNGTYATMGTNGIQAMDLSAGNGQNNGNVMRNAFMAGFMSGCNGHGFMNGFMQSMGRQMGVAGLNALRGQPMVGVGVTVTQQAELVMGQSKGFDMNLQSDVLADLGKPKENDLSGADINGDGVANDQQQAAAAKANENEPMDDKKSNLSARRAPNADLLGKESTDDNDFSMIDSMSASSKYM